MRRTLNSVAMAMAMASSVSVEAAPAYSWNLSRDMMTGITTNPFGTGNTWTAMYDAVGTSHNPANYIMMPTYNPARQGYEWATWENPAESFLLVGVATKTFNYVDDSGSFTVIQGRTTLHPSQTLSSILRWRSPINGKINISGRIADASAVCGNGIKWFVDKSNFTLMAGTLANGKNGKAILQQNIPVSAGTYLYFIVSSNGDNDCDTTLLDIIITTS